MSPPLTKPKTACRLPEQASGFSPELTLVPPPLPSPPLSPYIPSAAREGGYGDKWASE
jgi:hypothetical protein